MELLVVMYSYKHKCIQGGRASRWAVPLLRVHRTVHSLRTGVMEGLERPMQKGCLSSRDIQVCGIERLSRYKVDLIQNPFELYVYAAMDNGVATVRSHLCCGPPDHHLRGFSKPIEGGEAWLLLCLYPGLPSMPHEE
jgi:hypothetical protein